jgi:phospholipid/cholesterol/gamma-HCH transport system ATP-binding protein
MSVPVLEFRGVRAREGGSVINLCLEAGELALLLVEDRIRMGAVTELCAGLTPPAEGEVLFLGQAWAALSPEQADAARARIGGTFVAGGWPPQMTIADAVILPALHHRLAARDALVERAAELCRRFGLPGLPLGGPNALSESELARAALARAFLPRPALLLLETPLRWDAGPELPGQLVDALLEHRGSACLWMTTSLRSFNDRTIPAKRRFRIGAGGLAEVA